MADNRHLTKEEELFHGTRVQLMLGAKDELTLIKAIRAGDTDYRGVSIHEDNSQPDNIKTQVFARIQEKKKPGVKNKNPELIISGGLPGSTTTQLYIDTTRSRILFLKKLERDGKESVNTLTYANMGLVYNQAKKYHDAYPSGPSLKDMQQEGMVGLVTAILKYDPSRGNKFSTMATAWIYQAISRNTNSTGRLVKLPENCIADYQNIKRVTEDLEGSGLTKKEINEVITEEHGIKEDRIISILNAANMPLSLNYKTKGDGESESPELIETLSEFSAVDSPEENVITSEIFSAINTSLDLLNEIEKDVVSATFGMAVTDTGRRISMKNVRDKHDISISRAKKILDEALLKIKAGLEDTGFNYDDYARIV